ncbi:serine/threonine-protein kinase ppk16-like [Stegodyphus dumicola]|uniref:serine/threonine-protein kinase ppk16-like n=1 Tax=Stegodyphus dumicola TaxID=202533 RepID=UPI0015AFB561|nr:serine/threonine-protein kinase ppk16-like [Stegodyphus dumicola]
MELGWWPKLHHPNILPLLEYITLDACTVFIMPAMRKDLWMCVNEPRFYSEELSFGLCRIWLRDVATALDHLHEHGLCHLDLKLDNVFLKPDGYACLGDFSLLSDLKEVPEGFHFLELYEPPEYTHWCHGVPPPALSSGTKFGGDKADMWQFGILSVDLLTNLKLSSSKSSYFSMWHHDVWPFIEKILLHKEYLDYLLEDSFQNVIFSAEDFELCHDFINKILCMNPDSRISAREAMSHEFVNVPWPQLPAAFSLPTLVIEHVRTPRLSIIEEMKEEKKLPDPAAMSSQELEEVMMEPQEEDDLQAVSSIDAIDILKKKMKKIKREKIVRRESIAEADRHVAEIKPKPLVKIIPEKKEAEDSVATTSEKKKTISTANKPRPSISVATSTSKDASTPKTASILKRASTSKTASTPNKTFASKRASMSKTVSTPKRASTPNTDFTSKRASISKTVSTPKRPSSPKTASTSNRPSISKTTSIRRRSSSPKTASTQRRSSSPRTASTRRSSPKTASTRRRSSSPKTASISNRASISKTASTQKAASTSKPASTSVKFRQTLDKKSLVKYHEPQPSSFAKKKPPDKKSKKDQK